MSTGIFDTEESENATSRNNVFQLRKRTVVEVTNVVELTNIVDLDNVIEINSAIELSSLNSGCELSNVTEFTPADNSETETACMHGVCSISWKPNRPTAA